MNVPVLIVGGGGAGLTASMLLSRLGIESLLVSRYAETSPLPKAHILNQRTMEVFTDAGVAPAILARSTPPEHMRGVAWYTGLRGDGDRPYARRVAFCEGWGAGYTDPDYIAASPCATANLPQQRLEPILKAHAEAQPRATVRFHHELVDLAQDEDGVTSTVLDRDTGESYEVRSQYVIGADGGRTVGDLVGIELQGAKNILHVVTVHLSADLSAYFTDPEPFIRWVYNPDHPEHLDFGCVLIAVDPERWGSEAQEWNIHVPYAHADPAAADPGKVMKRIREALGVPGVDPVIHATGNWVMESVLAERFSAGRVFLIGDAAHRHPPTGGLGLNSAIQDAYNLSWKLAAVLHGRAGEALLDTYDAERRPVDAAHVEAAVAAAMSSMGADGKTVVGALGLSPAQTVDENWEALRPFFEDTPDAEPRRHALTQAVATYTGEFRQHGVDFGYSYSSAAIVDDGTPPVPRVDAVRIYQPSSRPGSPLPHAWVERAGQRLALGSLVHGGHFVLIAGEDGAPWVEAATAIASERGIPLRATRVGLGDADHIDVRFAWLKHRQITATGAVLVRPDRFIAFRAAEAADDPYAMLSSAFDQVLATTSAVITDARG